ncbi:hypothetical protein D1BOALGB6SA_7653 [Olavius sp. associated proteobacterium Delta 1]|nr:hypothetical protein D1BOALGB6SA_7653 [Olavius sp. associated proteobacterium Delta 1]
MREIGKIKYFAVEIPFLFSGSLWPQHRLGLSLEGKPTIWIRG